jgi:puromycin-sensitive aminopeptidase
MSTYLVAYVIGYYDYVETRDSNNVLIRVYTPVGKKEQGLFALGVVRKSRDQVEILKISRSTEVIMGR